MTGSVANRCAAESVIEGPAESGVGERLSDDLAHPGLVQPTQRGVETGSSLSQVLRRRKDLDGEKLVRVVDRSRLSSPRSC